MRISDWSSGGCSSQPGDAIAGAVVIGPRSPHRERLRDALSAQHEDLLWHEDAAALEAGARDFEPRVRRINETASSLARYLRSHPEIGSASCRERGGQYVEISGVAVELKKKNNT